MWNSIKVAGGVFGFMLATISIIFDIVQAGGIMGITIPFSILSGIGFLIFAGFMSWLLLSYRNRVIIFENASPNIVFQEIRESPLYRPTENETLIPIYHVLQAWFKNKPISPRETSIAKRITAEIEYWNKEASKRLFRVSGQWNIKPHAPDFIGSFQTDNKMDIFPNDEFAKLFIALKWEDDEDAYGYAIESFVHSQTMDGRDNGRKLPVGNFPVLITLKGVGITQSFKFIINNPGRGGNLHMTEMPKDKKRVGKENHIITQKEFHKLLKKASQPMDKTPQSDSK